MFYQKYIRLIANQNTIYFAISALKEIYYQESIIKFKLVNSKSMAKTLTAAAVMALVNSKKEGKIQYPGNVDIDLIRVPNMDYQMVFKWPTNQTGGSRCTATMIRPDVALTAAHCLSSSEDGVNPGLDA